MKTVTHLLLIVVLAACAQPSSEVPHADEMDHEEALHAGMDMSEAGVSDVVEAFRAAIVAQDSTTASGDMPGSCVRGVDQAAILAG
jgi:hypothetical protein